jgi:hypothetical protein
VERCCARRFLKRCEFQVDFANFANEEAAKQYLGASRSPVVCLHYFCSVNSVCLVTRLPGMIDKQNVSSPSEEKLEKPKIIGAIRRFP